MPISRRFLNDLADRWPWWGAPARYGVQPAVTTWPWPCDYDTGNETEEPKEMAQDNTAAETNCLTLHMKDGTDLEWHISYTADQGKLGPWRKFIKWYLERPDSPYYLFDSMNSVQLLTRSDIKTFKIQILPKPHDSNI